MAQYNKIIMIGNLTREPEYKQLQSGQAVTKLGIAVNRKFKNKQTGMETQEVCFIDVDVWGTQAESCNQYLSKGKQVLVEGRLKMDSWQDQQGNARTKHAIIAEKVVFLTGVNIEQDEDSAKSDYSKNDRFASTEKKFDSGNTNFAKEKTIKTAKTSEQKNKGNFDLPAFKDESPFDDELPF